MNFELISLKHKDAIDNALKSTTLETADRTFVNLWLWRFGREISVAAYKDFMVIGEQESSKPPCFLFPLGSAEAAIGHLVEHCKSTDIPLCFRALTTVQAERLKEILGNRLELFHNGDHDDYLYDAQALITLSGKAYHAKKNFVNRFETLYGVCYERLDNRNLGETIAFINRWFDRSAYKVNGEREGIVELLKDYGRFSCSYGILRTEGQIVGLTIGEELSSECVVIHVEKADGIGYPGSYQVLNQAHLKHEWADKQIVNREEDLGLEGLRRAKLSYRPIGFAQKFEARVNVT
ncbi:MAG: phosphatidylglycerol lysyltransferase domain-containing protein [Helicobacteraceae bacterium]|jgi:hypothetical protein|nr:phosphatidylglycerol lysyltransferase domain-containing protein [Helicobacteraceae bacterium]